MSPLPVQLTYREGKDQYGNTVYYNTTDDRIKDGYANIGANIANSAPSSSYSSNNFEGISQVAFWILFFYIMLFVKYIKLWFKNPRAALALTFVLVSPVTVLAVPFKFYFPDLDPHFYLP